MPVYKITQDSTGITLNMEGERPPTQEEVEGAFQQYASMNKPQKGYFDRLTENVMGVAPEPVELTQAPAAPIKRPEGFPEDTLTARPTFQERMQRPEIKSKIFPALAALEQQVTEDLTRQFVTKPAGSRLEREGVMAPFAASPEKREVFKEAFQSAGRAIGPKTEAASGVVGEAVADLLTAPGSILTAGIATGLRGVATIPETLRTVEGAVTASELQSAARTARTAQALERGAVVGFAEPTIESAVVSTREAAGILDSNAPVEDKVRATTQAGLSLLFAGLLGAGAKEVGLGSLRKPLPAEILREQWREAMAGNEQMFTPADLMENMASRQISARDAAINLKRVRDEIAFAEATLPKRSFETISPEEMRAEQDVRRRLSETKALMDQALNEAVQARVIDTGELTAIERLRLQSNEVIGPERLWEGPRVEQREPTPQRTLPSFAEGEPRFGEAITPELPIEAQRPSQLRTAAEIAAEAAAERGRPEPVPLETVAEKLKKSLAERDNRMAAEAIAEALESGAAQGEPVPVTRKLVEAQLGIGKEPTTTAAAEKIIFNELWDAEIQRQGVGRFSQAAEGLTQALENLRVDVDPGLGANPIPQLLGTSWNGALVVAQSMIKGGAKLADAIEKAVRYVRYDFKGKFDEAALRKELETALTSVKPDLKITSPEGMKPRRFAERVVASESIPREVREVVAASPDASLTPQVWDEAKAVASSQTKDQLAADIANRKSNTRIISGIELTNRLIGEDNFTEAGNLFLNMASDLTTAAQILNQAKLLKSTTPDGMIFMLKKLAEKEGRKLEPKILDEVKNEMVRYKLAKNEVVKLEGAMRYMTEQGAPQQAIDGVGRALLQEDLTLRDANDSLVIALAKANPEFSNKILSIFQGSVLIPKSASFNLLSNILTKPPQELASLTAATISQMESMLTGKPPAVVYDWKARWPGRFNSLKYSFPEVWKTLIKGAEVGTYEAGKNFSQPLNFQRALGELFQMVQDPRTFTPGQFARSLTEGTIGAVPDILLRGLAAGDIFIKIADKRMFIEELGRKYGLSEGQIKLAQRDLDLVKITDEQAKQGRKGLTQEQINEINFEADRAVYQQENAGTEAVNQANRWVKRNLGTGPYIVYRIATALFQKTPVNMVAEGLNFTPGLGSVRDYKSLSPREKRIVVSKQIIGGMVMSGVALLEANGLITPMLDTAEDTQKERNLAEAKGAFPPGGFNWTGTKRLVAGGDPTYRKGDDVIYIEKLGIAGVLANMYATAKRDFNQSSTAQSKVVAIGLGSVAGFMNYLTQQQMVEGGVGFVKLLSKDYSRAFKEFAENTLITAASPVAPSILAAIDRAQRKWVPNLKGNTIFQTVVNELNRRSSQIGIQIPGATKADELPLRRDMWGAGIEQTPAGSVLGEYHPWINAIFWPLKQKTLENDPLNAEIYRLWSQTDSSKVVPSIPDPKVEHNNQTYEMMTPQQYDRYTQLIGFFRRRNAERLYFSSAFANGSDPQRIAMLSEAYNEGAELGKYQFMKELKSRGESLTPEAPKRGFKSSRIQRQPVQQP